MQEFYEKNKQLVIGGVIVLVLLVVGGVFAVMRPSTQTADETTITDEEMETPIPTVGPDVKVNVEGIDNNRSLLVSVDNVPDGTETIELEVGYMREEADVDGPIADGSFKDLKIDGNRAEAEILLGTESSGVKRYHVLTDGEIRAVLLFKGEYGEFDEQIYEGTFQLDGFENADEESGTEDAMESEGVSETVE